MASSKIRTKFEAGTTVNLKKAIVRSLNKKVAAAIKEYKSNIRSKVVDILTESFYDHPAYTSIVFGKLKGEFGLTSADEKMDAIIQYIVSKALRIDVSINKIGSDIKGSTSISVGVNFGELLSLNEAFQITDDDVLPWLYWLLLSGGKREISNYQVVQNTKLLGRSGLPFLMIESKKGYRPGDTTGGEFIGTLEDNYVLDCIYNTRTKIQNLARKQMRVAIANNLR